MGDAEAYDLWARQIVAGDWFGSTVYYQSPFYPYFLAAFYALGGDTLTVKLAQTVLGSASCVLLGLAAQRWFDRRTGLLAAWLLAFNPTAIFFDGLIQKGAPETFLTALFLMMFARSLQSSSFDGSIRSRWRIFALGIVLGLLSISRENSLPWAGVVVVALALRGGEQALGASAGNVPSRALRIRYIALFLLGIACTMAPTAIRNRVVGGEWHLTTSQFGSNFYIGNHEGADGLYQPLVAGRGQAKYERDDAFSIAERELGKQASPREVSRFWFDRARVWIASHPGEWLKLTALKLLLAWNIVEIGDTEDQYAMSDESVVLRALTALLPSAVIFVAAAIGGFATRRRARELGPLYALIATYAATIAAFYVFARYRFPLITLSLPLAAAGIWSVVDAAQSRKLPELARYTSIGLAATVVVLWPIPDIVPARFAAGSYYNFGVSWSEQGRLAEAETAFRKAVALRPKHAAAWNNLGDVLHRLRRNPEAQEAYERALDANERLAPAWNNLGVVRLEQGRTADAEKDFQRALALDPSSADAYMNLGNLAAGQGRFAEATVQYRQALALQPDHPLVRINLGNALQNLNLPGEAVDVLREAVRIAPGRVEAHHNLGNALAELHADVEAEAEYRAALAIDARSYETWLSLGRLATRSGRRVAAMEALQQVQQLAPADSPAQRQADELIRRARALP